MHKKRMYLLIMSLTFCMVLSTLYCMHLQQKNLIEYLSFVDNRHQLPIVPYYDEVEEKYYLFLPSYASLEDITPSCPSNVNIRFGGGDDFSNLSLSEDVPMILSTSSRTEEYILQIWPCANLTTIYLETQSGSMDYIHEDKNNKEDVSVSIIKSDGTIDFSGIGKIHGRGNTTWLAAKKPYNLTFSHSISFGIFQDISQFCLLANHYDDSQLRNATIYFAAQKLNFPYCSPYLYADLYINGEYYGLYGIVTKQEYMKHLEEDQIHAVFEIATMSESINFSTPLLSGVDLGIRVLYGNESEIHNLVQQFESSLLSKNWGSCAEIIDMDSFAHRYAFEEFFGNYDLTAGSKFFYLGNDSKIHSMLPWDYDMALGNYISAYNDLCINEIFASCIYLDNNWFSQLLHNELFIESVYQIYRNCYSSQFIKSLNNYISNNLAIIASSHTSNFLRWKNTCDYAKEDINYSSEILDSFHSTLDNYFPARHSFLLDYYHNRSNYRAIHLYGPNPYLEATLFFPQGLDVSSALQNSYLIHFIQNQNNFLSWDTQNGTDPYTITTLNSNITCIAIYASNSA